jgi:hypothetical protein
MTTIVRRRDRTPLAGEEWEVAIRKCAISAHQAFLRHPWTCSLAMSPGSTRGARESRLRYIEWLLGRLPRGWALR